MPTTTIEKPVKNQTKKALNFSKKQYLKWYKDMLVMRKVEERVGHLYIQQKFGGFCHLYIGQEALVAGTIMSIQEKKSAKGTSFAIVKFSDNNSEFEIFLFSQILQ